MILHNQAAATWGGVHIWSNTVRVLCLPAPSCYPQVVVDDEAWLCRLCPSQYRCLLRQACYRCRKR